MTCPKPIKFDGYLVPMQSSETYKNDAVKFYDVTLMDLAFKFRVENKTMVF